jgi:hypothetical protein
MEIDEFSRDELTLVCLAHLISIWICPDDEECLRMKRSSKLRRALKRKCGIVPPPNETSSSSGGVPPTSLPSAKTKDSSSSNAPNIPTLDESFALLAQGNGGAPSDVPSVQVPPPAYWIGLGRPPPAPNWQVLAQFGPPPTAYWIALGRPPPAPNWPPSPPLPRPPPAPNWHFLPPPPSNFFVISAAPTILAQSSAYWVLCFGTGPAFSFYNSILVGPDIFQSTNSLLVGLWGGSLYFISGGITSQFGFCWKLWLFLLCVVHFTSEQLNFFWKLLWHYALAIPLSFDGTNVHSWLTLLFVPTPLRSLKRGGVTGYYLCMSIDSVIP